MLNKNYSRYAGQVNLSSGSWQYFLGASFGSEIFGVHNDGAIFYSSPDEHTSGWNLGLQYSMSLNSTLKIQMATENYSKGTTTEVVNSSATALSTVGIFTF